MRSAGPRVLWDFFKRTGIPFDIGGSGRLDSEDDKIVSAKRTNEKIIDYLFSENNIN